MDKIRELKQKILSIVTEARKRVDGAEKENRNLNTEELAFYTKAMADVSDIQARVARMEDQVRLERTLAQSTSEPNRPDPQAGSGDTRVAPQDTPEYRGEFRQFLREGVVGIVMRALQADSPTAGGYLVPPQEFITKLIKAVDDIVFMRRICTVMPLTSAASLGAAELTDDPEDADWTAEITSADEDTAMAVGKRELKPNPLSKLAKISNKLLRIAAISAETLVKERLAYKFGITGEKAYMTGNGANRPLGIFTASASGINTGRDIRTSAATAWNFDSLKTVKYTLKSQYHRNAQWVMHRDAVLKTSLIKDGDGKYAWQPAANLGDPDRLLGFPINMTEYAPNTYTANLYAAVLGDFKAGYWIVEMQKYELQRLNELFARTNQTGFIGRTESDGAPVLQEAFVRMQMKAS